MSLAPPSHHPTPHHSRAPTRAPSRYVSRHVTPAVSPTPTNHQALREIHDARALAASRMQSRVQSRMPSRAPSVRGTPLGRSRSASPTRSSAQMGGFTVDEMDYEMVSPGLGLGINVDNSSRNHRSRPITSARDPRLRNRDRNHPSRPSIAQLPISLSSSLPRQTKNETPFPFNRTQPSPTPSGMTGRSAFSTTQKKRFQNVAYRGATALFDGFDEMFTEQKLSRRGRNEEQPGIVLQTDQWDDRTIVRLFRTAVRKDPAHSFPSSGNRMRKYPDVARISEDTIVKRIDGDPSKPDENVPSEVLAMEFVRNNTSIPVPRVQRVIKSTARSNRTSSRSSSSTFESSPSSLSGEAVKKSWYVVMEYVEGYPLSDIWGEMTFSNKIKVVFTLRAYIRQLRDLTQGGKKTQSRPPLLRPKTHEDWDTIANPLVLPRSSSAMGRSSTDSRSSSWEGRDPGGKPIRTRTGFLASLSQEFSNGAGQSDDRNVKSLVFSHHHLALHHVILGHDGKLTLVDWSEAGFYPGWAEYVGMLEALETEESRLRRESSGESWEEPTPQKSRGGSGLSKGDRKGKSKKRGFWKWTVPFLTGPYQRQAAWLAEERMVDEPQSILQPEPRMPSRAPTINQMFEDSPPERHSRPHTPLSIHSRRLSRHPSGRGSVLDPQVVIEDTPPLSDMNDDIPGLAQALAA